MAKIKWGVIGCGGIAYRRTIPGMMLSENSELVAVMDTNFESVFGKNYERQIDLSQGLHGLAHTQCPEVAFVVDAGGVNPNHRPHTLDFHRLTHRVGGGACLG